MFSLANIQPQVVAALTQAGNIINTARLSSHVHRSGKRSEQNELQKKGKVATSEENKTRNETAKVPSIHQIAMDLQDTDIVDAVRYFPKDLSDHVLSAVTEVREGKESKRVDNKWKTSHVSYNTFFQNKTGFPESNLSSRGNMDKSFFCSKFFHCLLHDSVPLNSQQQRRGFKTKRAESEEGNVNFFWNIFGLKSRHSTGDENTLKVLKVFSVEGGENKHIANLLLPDKGAKKFHPLIYILVIAGLGFGLFKMLTTGKVAEALGPTNEIDPETVTTLFEDVRGADEAKEELQDIVNFLRDPRKFTELGAKLPKGVLLVGPPGVGKTMLARAVAGEAKVPFFRASGSEFDEIFVGSGSRKIRGLFNAAKRRGPCVVFIDEIDSVGRKRTGSSIAPYANQTINQLLNEMDGFSPNSGVIVLGATNKRDILDSALVRAGRFDVEVRVDIPDLAGRTSLFDFYLGKIRCDPLVDQDALAKSTVGFTGADIETMVNQAAIRAALEDSEVVRMSHLEYSKDKIRMGPAKKNKLPDVDALKATAYHEAGHTLVAHYTKDATPIYKVTILPRGGTLGHTSLVPNKDELSQSKSQLLAHMDVCMGGRIAEELHQGEDKVSTGAMSDFQRATSIANNMVKNFGMSEKVGVRFINKEEMEYSESTKDLVDTEVKKLIQESYDRAKHILNSHKAELKKLAEALLEHETLDKKQVEDVLSGKHKST